MLFGANGMRVGPDSRLYVAQAFGSQVSAIDVTSGALTTISPIGGSIVAPDDLAFSRAQVRRLSALVNDLLDVTRIDVVELPVRPVPGENEPRHPRP